MVVYNLSPVRVISRYITSDWDWVDFGSFWLATTWCWCNKRRTIDWWRNKKRASPLPRSCLNSEEKSVVGLGVIVWMVVGAGCHDYYVSTSAKSVGTIRNRRQKESSSRWKVVKRSFSLYRNSRDSYFCITLENKSFVLSFFRRRQ